jgi:hypothetical protein
MAFTVVPLRHLRLPLGTKIPFAPDFFLEDLPLWVKEDKGTLTDLSLNEREAILDGRHAFVSQYDAASIGQPDFEWPKESRRSIQKSKSENAILANLAIWLQHPSPVSFTTVLHAIQVIQSVESQQLPLLCLASDLPSHLNENDISKAGELYAVIRRIQRTNSAWTAMRALWAALTTNQIDIRYSLLWISLEALLGDEDGGEIIHKIAERIALFLASTPTEARQLFHKAKNSYSMRSKIVHGRYYDDPKINQLMADTEAIIRDAFRHLLHNPELLKTFTSKKSRNEYLGDLIFSRIKHLGPLLTDDPSLRSG